MQTENEDNVFNDSSARKVTIIYICMNHNLLWCTFYNERRISRGSDHKLTNECDVIGNDTHHLCLNCGFDLQFY